MLLGPSMMCADLKTIETEVKELESAGVDFFHCDIMDGQFVPNFALGLEDIKAIKASTNLLVDCHLMIENPAKNIDLFIEAGCDLIYIHPEAESYPIKTLQHIKASGKLAGIAINPATSIAMIEEILPHVDYLMVMTVTPGFAGQKFIHSITTKIEKLIAMQPQFGYKLMIDGACSPEVVAKLSNLGCDGFVLGTSALFNKGIDYETLIANLREGR